MIHESVHVDAIRDDLETLVLDADLLEAVIGTTDPRTKAYVERRTAEGKSKREIIRCLKRFVAREVYAALCPKPVTPDATALDGL